MVLCIVTDTGGLGRHDLPDDDIKFMFPADQISFLPTICVAALNGVVSACSLAAQFSRDRASTAGCLLIKTKETELQKELKIGRR